MIKKLLPLLTFLAIVFSAQSQTDYSKVTFSSKIYKYKKANPRTQEIGIDKNLVINIIELLSDTLYSEREKTEIVNRAWLAFKAPKTFDFVYKDFAIKTNKSWSQISSTGNLVVEPNPYLTEWTINDDEFPYFQIALNRILDYYSLISYADDVSSVKASFNELLVTKDLTFNDPSDEDWAYSYLQSVNNELAKKGLIALVTKGYYDIIVCKINKKEELTDLFKRINWDLVTP